MPMSVALRNCPAAVVLPVDRAAYVEASQAVMAIFADVTPSVEPLSLDEAFLDVSSARRLLGRPADIARHIRARVFAEQRLTCSVGIAPTKFVAKVASARCKPDGMLVVPADGVLSFCTAPDHRAVGSGAEYRGSTGRLGLRTVGDVAGTPPDVLRRSVGVGTADHLGALARGEDPRSVQTEHVEKSISADRTFDVDLTAAADVERELLRLAEEVGRRVRERGMLSRTVGIKVRYADFPHYQPTRTLAEPTDNSSHIYESALALCRLLAHDQPRIRLLGVKAESLRTAHEAARQLSLDDVLGSQPEPPSALDQIADLARKRFGAGAVQPGTLIRRRDSAS